MIEMIVFAVLFFIGLYFSVLFEAKYTDTRKAKAKHAVLLALTVFMGLGLFISMLNFALRDIP